MEIQNPSEIERKLASLTAWIAAGLGFALVLAVSFIAVAVWQANAQASDRAHLVTVATQTHDALCAFKIDLRGRYRDGLQFEQDVKAGRRPPIPGITDADFVRSLVAQKSTLDSLENLKCS